MKQVHTHDHKMQALLSLNFVVYISHTACAILLKFKIMKITRQMTLPDRPTSIVRSAILILTACGPLFLGLFALATAPVTGLCQEPECSGVGAINISETKKADGSIWSPQIELKGLFGLKTATHPAQGEFRSYVLFLFEPLCFHGDFMDLGDNKGPTYLSYPNTTHIQLALNDAIKGNMESMLGQTIHVSGRLFSWSTAWHTTPLVMEVKSFVTKS